MQCLHQLFLSILEPERKVVERYQRDVIHLRYRQVHFKSAPSRIARSLTALAFHATVDWPERFRRSRDEGAHLGITPRRYPSGETDVQGWVRRCGDELAHTLLYEAAKLAKSRETA